jgi:hypothetical protein
MREHLILFTFFNCYDYNLFYVKIERFLTLICFEMTFNGLFFIHETMYGKYVSEEEFTFVQKLPQLIFTLLASHIIEVILCFFCMTDDHIYEIKEISKENPQLFVENYETDCLEISLPFSGQYNEGYEVFKKRLNIMPGFPSNILLQYLQYKIVISFSVDIFLPLNDPRYPKFHSYITFKNGKDELEFRNLSNQSFPQDFPVQGSNLRQIRQQVNTDSFDATKFIQLFGDDKKVKMKLFIIKYHYEQ